MIHDSSIKEQILAFIVKRVSDRCCLLCIDEISNKWHLIHLEMSLLNGVVICLVSGMLSAKICTPFKILHLALLSFATLQCQEDTFFYCIPFLQRSQTVFLCTFRVLDINEMNSNVLSMFL